MPGIQYLLYSKHYRATWAFSVRLAMYHVFGIPLASSASADLMLGLAKR
jgi:hypothetical protein